MNTSVKAYVILLRALTQERLSPPDFVTVFLFAFKNDPAFRESPAQETLDAVFYAVEDYCEDEELRADDPECIGPDQLREAAGRALETLAGID